MDLRDNIEEKYKWDLSSYYENIEQWDKDIERIKLLTKDIKQFEEKLNNKENILFCLNLQKEYNEVVEMLSVYIFLKMQEDLSNSFYQNKYSMLNNLLSDLSADLSFVITELNELDNEFLMSLIEDNDLKDFNLMLKEIQRNKKHILSKTEEELLSRISVCTNASSDVFDMYDAVDVKFEDVEDINGNKHSLTNSNYITYIIGKDAKLRETAFKNLNNGYGKINYTLATNYLNNVKTNCAYAKIRGFKSAFSQALFNENVDEEVYTTLLEMVNKNTKLIQKYAKLKAQTLNIKNFKNCDINTEINLDKKRLYTYDEAYDLVLEVLNILGDDYIKILKLAKEQKWIDVMPNLNKSQGAFSTSAFLAHPIVLLNFEGSNESVSTLAHELGHMMHSYYSNKNNPSTKANYEIFVAEVASTVNEMILAKTLLNRSTTKQEKIYHLDSILNLFFNTVFRQTMFAEFEYQIHSKYENQEDVSCEAINQTYYNLAKKYFGDIELLDEIKFEWSRIPHFYNSFYVYKYATGLISAISISNKILKGYKQSVKLYKEFLSSGCTKPPVQLLKDAGVDLKKEETFNNAFNFIEQLLDEWENLMLED